MNKTITTIFMVPTLAIPKGALRATGFVNAFISDKDREEDYGENKVIYLLFKPNDLDECRLFVDNEYDRTENIIEDYDYSEGYIVVIYKLNLKYSSDFELVREGKYSKLSSNFKKMFPKIIKIKKRGLHRDEISLQYRVFNRTPDLIEFWEKKIGIDWTDDMEVWTGWDKTNEILNITKIKEENYEKSN